MKWTWSPAPLRLPLPSLRLPGARPRLSALPLRVTALVTLLLLAAPALVLLRMPRPRAEGLGRLLPHAGLLQSFPSAPERQPPPLWKQRLDGPTAELLWRQQRQIWWQFWSHDPAASAYLVMPLPRQIRVGAVPAPPNSLQIDGLLVVSSGPQAQRYLQDQLVQASRRQQGLQQRCLAMLEREPAAYWSSRGLASMAGPIAPLLQALEEGCLALELVPGELALSGEAGPAAPASAGQTPPPPDSPEALPEPIGEGLLLRLSGRSLDPLLSGLLARQEVREAIDSVYGLGEDELALLRQAPFELRLRPVLAGPFQAGLELAVPVEGDPAPWIAILGALGQRLVARGLQDAPAPPIPAAEAANPADPAAPAAPGGLLSTTWRDEQGRQVGGWRWHTTPGQPLQLLLFLGPEPEALGPESEAPPADGLAETLAEGPTADAPLPLLRLQVRPQALAALNLLPGQLPLPLLQARQLLLLADDGGRGGGISRLLGRLQLGEPAPIQSQNPPPAAEPPQQALPTQP